MTSIRMSVIGLLVALLAIGCGGSASSAPADAGNDTGAAASEDAGGGTEATPVPAGDGGASAEEAARVGEALVPPNSTEVSKTTTDTYWYVLYESTDSPETLKGWYENEIPKTGMKIDLHDLGRWVVRVEHRARRVWVVRRRGHGRSVREWVGQFGDRGGRQLMGSTRRPILVLATVTLAVASGACGGTASGSSPGPASPSTGAAGAAATTVAAAPASAEAPASEAPDVGGTAGGSAIS